MGLFSFLNKNKKMYDNIIVDVDTDSKFITKDFIEYISESKADKDGFIETFINGKKVKGKWITVKTINGAWKKALVSPDGIVLAGISKDIIGQKLNDENLKKAFSKKE